MNSNFTSTDYSFETKTSSCTS